MIIIVMVKFVDEGGHCHHGKHHHHGGNGHKYAGKAILGGRKKTFLGKEIGIQHANAKSYVDDYGRKDALPPDGTHGDSQTFFVSI
jgi:hypothetical protein